MLGGDDSIRQDRHQVPPKAGPQREQRAKSYLFASCSWCKSSIPCRQHPDSCSSLAVIRTNPNLAIHQVSVLRQRLSYIADVADAKASGASSMPSPDLAHPRYVSTHQAADLLAIYILHHEQAALRQSTSANTGELEHASTMPEVSFLCPKRAQELAKIDLERDVWLPLRAGAVPICDAVALETSMPRWLITRWLPKGDAEGEGLKQGILDLARAFNEIPPVYIRANLLKLQVCCNLLACTH